MPAGPGRRAARWSGRTRGVRIVGRRTLISGAAAAWLVVAAASAQAASRGEAESIATRTGEIIGGASACGISEGELVALGAKVIR